MGVLYEEIGTLGKTKIMKYEGKAFRLLILTILPFASLLSCSKDAINDPAPTPPPTVISQTNGFLSDSDVNRSVTSFKVRQSPDSTDYAQSSNGTLYYDNSIILSPGTGSYMSPIHLLKKNNIWTLDPDKYGNIIDRARNTYKVTENTYVWANAGTESDTNPSGNLYISTSNPDKSLTWRRLSDKNFAEFYHYAAAGDVDGDGISDIMSFVGVETQSPELFKLFKGPNYTEVNIKFPDGKEFEAALGITKEIKETVGRNFSFGSICAADLDGDSKCELILTSTDVKVNNYYSFIIMKYENNAFKIHKIIKPGGALKDNKMAVADVRVGDFNGDKINDVVVSMGDYNENAGIQVWTNTGGGNLVASDKKKELHGKLYNNDIIYSNFDVGKFRGNDCVFLFFEGARYVPRPQSNLDLNPFLLISSGNDEGFTHLSNIPLQKDPPSYLKGYFENNTLRMIGIRGIRWHEFEVIDMTLK